MRVDNLNNDEKLAYTSPEERYHISSSTRYPVNLFQWLKKNQNDPITKVLLQSDKLVLC